MNELKLSGKVGTQPVVRYTPGGIAIAEFRLGHGVKKKAPTGADTYDMEWFSVTCFSDLADYAAKLTVGQIVYIEGRVQQQGWVDKNTGQKREKVGIVAQHIEPYVYQRQQQKPAVTAPPLTQPINAGPVIQSMPATGVEFTDDDIPF